MLSLDDYLKPFPAVTLDQLESFNFSERRDSKSIFAERLLWDFLERLVPYYHILEHKGKRIFPYESLYFDTADLRLFRDHHRGVGHRNKVRYRKYVDTDTTFFEIKAKDNKGVNHKLRIPAQLMQHPLPPELQEVVRRETELDPESLTTTLSVELNRITLIHRDGSEKVTFDSDIQFKFKGNSKAMEGIVITEVKQKKFNPESDFLKIQHQLGVRPASVSKYCLGISLLAKEVKANRFKAGLLRIEKMMA